MQVATKTHMRFLVAATLALVLGLFQPITAQAQKFTVLYAFRGGNDGGGPFDAPLLDKAGNLYGTTAFDGKRGAGVVYKVPSGTRGKETVIHTFEDVDGFGGYGPLIFDEKGNLYGEGVGGENNHGVVYRLSPNQDGTWTQAVLYNFFGSEIDGDTPSGGLVSDAAGNLYGSTLYGGGRGCSSSGGCGTIFKLSPSDGAFWKETILYRFSGGAGGQNPNAVVLDRNGNIYGTAFGGGNTPGTVFRLTPSGNRWMFELLHTFGKGNDGAFPAGPLIFGKSGKLYGTTTGGGLLFYGTIFELSQDANGKWLETVIYSFTGNADGCTPYGAVTSDANGNLFGTTSGGAPYCNNTFGSVYELKYSPGLWTVVPLHDFAGGADGDTPLGGVVLDKAGNLYGTTSSLQGLGNVHGNVFEVSSFIH